MRREPQGYRDSIAYTIGEGQALCLPFADVSVSGEPLCHVRLGNNEGPALALRATERGWAVAHDDGEWRQLPGGGIMYALGRKALWRAIGLNESVFEASKWHAGVSLLPGGGAVIADVGSKNGTSIEAASGLVAERVAVADLVDVKVRVGEASREGNSTARSLHCARRGLFGVMGDHGGEEMDRFALLTYSRLAPWQWLVQPSGMVAAQLARAMAKARQVVPDASARLNGGLVQVMAGPLEVEQRVAWATYGAAALYHVGRGGVRRQDRYKTPAGPFSRWLQQAGEISDKSPHDVCGVRPGEYLVMTTHPPTKRDECAVVEHAARTASIGGPQAIAERLLDIGYNDAAKEAVTVLEFTDGSVESLEPQPARHARQTAMG